ncbi:cation transporter, partial [Verminephrobacter sp. Larva24]
LALSSGVAIVRQANREGTVQTDSTSTQLKSILRKEEA